jgi:A/G-specific adenine glycosylase
MEDKDKTFVKALLKWYKTNKREFPWRNENLTPFQLLMAELMLQKTNAAQVEKIFPDFIDKYPNPLSISELEESFLSDLLKPLGLYNRRARDLKKLTEMIISDNNTIPKSKKQLLELPGVGDYIANALLCFAFNIKVPIIDANVGRIMKRIYSFPVKGAPSRDKKLTERMQEIIPDKYFKSFNYAILDFAALLCLPRNPRCDECPLCDFCDYYQGGTSDKE